MKQPQKNRTRIRLTVDLEPAVYQTFHDLAQSTRQGMGRTIGDWLLDTQEAAQHVADLCKDVRAQPSRAAHKLHSYAVGLSTLTEKLVEDAQAADRKGQAAPDVTARSGGASGAAGAFPLPAAKVQAYADTNGVPPVTPRSVIRGETTRGKGKP